MSDFKVPKRKVTAEARLGSLGTHQWDLFLSEMAETHAGPERPTDLLNRKSRFLPVLDKDDGPVVVNCASLLVVTVPADAELPGGSLAAEDLAGEMSVAAKVELSLDDGSKVSGTLVYLQPEGKRRVQDFLNGAPQFVPIRDGESVHIVNTHRLVLVKTMAEDV